MSACCAFYGFTINPHWSLVIYLDIGAGQKIGREELRQKKSGKHVCSSPEAAFTALQTGFTGCRGDYKRLCTEGQNLIERKIIKPSLGLALFVLVGIDNEW